jgi:hypothetical protein
MRIKVLRPLLAALLFVALSVYFTYYFNNTSELGLFLSSPFNMTTEGDLLYNLYLPAMLIFILGVYLKNFNSSFQRKCNLRSIFVISILASYVKSFVGMQYYRGYADFGISLGTSIITLSFAAATIISMEVYIEDKERLHHLYGRFMFVLLSVLLLLLGVFTFLSFFVSSSLLVHLIGLMAFLLLFIPWYERANIIRAMRSEEHAVAAMERRITRNAPLPAPHHSRQKR